MENQATAGRQRVISIKIPGEAGDTPVSLIVDDQNRLTGALNIEALRRWAAVNHDSPSAKTAVPDDLTKRDIRLFTNTPCWFEGCEELRRAYEGEVQRINSKADGCKPCEKGAIIRKYLKLAALKQNASPS